MDRSPLHGRPLLDTRLDMTLYVDRPAAQDALARAAAQGLNVLVEGPRGSGRTTLLRAMLFAARAGDTGERPVYVRAATAGTPAELLQLVADALVAGDARNRADLDGLDGLAGLDALDELDGLDAVAALGSRATGLLSGGRRHTVYLDDVDSRVGNQLFGVLRDEVWALPIRWVVAATDDDAAVLLRPPADAFFEARVALAPLTRDEAADLVARRLGHAVTLPDTPERWTPREAMDLARLAPADWDEEVAARARRDEQVALLGRPATMLVTALEELGPVSPSDERLLDRMGWTSSRASQVLRQLLAVGVVAYREVRGDRPGRPARLYELTPLRG